MDPHYNILCIAEPVIKSSDFAKSYYYIIGNPLTPQVA